MHWGRAWDTRPRSLVFGRQKTGSRSGAFLCSIPHLSIPRMSQTSRELALNCSEVCVCVCVHTLKRNVCQEEQSLVAVLKATGYMEALGWMYSMWQLPRHLDKLVCDLCLGDKMFWSSPCKVKAQHCSERKWRLVYFNLYTPEFFSQIQLWLRPAPYFTFFKVT